MAQGRRHRLRERAGVDPEHGVSPVKLIDMRFIIALGSSPARWSAGGPPKGGVYRPRYAQEA